jgi:eukaryotic-like serine/threonine-protein kinase
MPAVTPLTEKVSFAYSAGDLIADKYLLEELLGEGGMGAVFRARNTAIDMAVALKLIRADLDRELLTGRLLQEARAAAKLSHPSIVRVFDVGQTDLGDPFIVMELLQGESLASVIDRDGRLTALRAVQLLLPIADGLAVAHAKGFVHRDVKPDNVFIAVDEEGQLQPKLVDFGIVKQVQQSGASHLTQLGAVVGSPEYMSPEQARGLEHIDARSDVWSFSILLYEAITGETPFQSTSYNALLRLIVETDPASLSELAAADSALSAIVARGLSKDPAARWPSMTELGKALATWLIDQGVSADACGVSLQARWLWRPSDPTALGRISIASSPDGWPEPLSGVRAVDTLRERLGRSTPPHSPSFANAPTVHVAKQAETPAPLSDRQAPRSTRKKLPLALAGAGAVLALGVGWSLTPSKPTPRPTPAPAEANDSSSLRAETAAATATALAPSSSTVVLVPAATEARAPSPQPSSAPAAAKPKHVAPRASAAEPAAQPATERRGEPSDLLAPY